MEIRYLNKESLKELSFYVKTRDYYKEKLEKLREIKNEVTDQASSITINISYKTKESYNSKAIEIHRPVGEISSHFEFIPATVIKEVEDQLLFCIACIESYLWDRFGYTDDEAVIQQSKQQQKLMEFLSKGAAKIEFNPNDYADVEDALKKILEPLKNIRNDLEKVVKNIIESNGEGQGNGGAKHE